MSGFRRLCGGHIELLPIKSPYSPFWMRSSFLFFPLQGSEMNEIQNRKARNDKKPFEGCMGRMVNLFDLSANVTRNRLLTEKAHRDGLPVYRNQSDVAKVLEPIKDQIEDKSTGYESRMSSSNKKSSGTPMKMLIAQEMSKETESKHKPPSVVAKLMGLDALPVKQLNSTAQKSPPRGYLRNTYTPQGTLSRYQHQELGFRDKPIQHEIHQFEEQREYKDVYEVRQQSSRTNSVRDKLPQKGKHNQNIDEKRMALVRQKFIEAKRLATDEKLRQSKEFQDALEVLSSNKDLFLKFLQEPNSLFSQHLYELQSIPPPPQTNRITVLKPSKTMENRYAGAEKHEGQTKKQTQLIEANGWDKDRPNWSSVFTNQKDDSSAQPTRIVVLKPSPGKTHDVRTVGSSPTSSPRLQSSKGYYGEPEDDEAQDSRGVAMEITQQMHENLSGHHRNETLLSSVFSNGYVGDDSSLNRSENEYVEEGNLSDSEVMTPTSRHSWDYINRFGSPYSSSSFSRASYSPESSVCREAKKRLSERWTLMTSNGSGPEQRQVRRSSSTLGEMLALSDTKKTARSGEEDCDGSRNVFSSRSCGGEQDLMAPTLSGSTSRDEDESGSTRRGKDESVEVSPRNLVRSRSVPVSSTVYGSRLNVEVPDPEMGKSIVLKEETKSKSRKSSFKGKVSSLFFFRGKKTSKGKPSSCPWVGSQEESPSTPSEVPTVANLLSPQKTSNNISHCITDGGLVGDPSSQSSSLAICVGAKQGSFSNEPLLSVAKPGVPVEIQDQPSPISVLEAPFEDDVSTTPLSSGHVMSEHCGQAVHHHSLKSNLIDKSPPIESIARTLSWDDACILSTEPNPLNPSKFSLKAREEEEEEQLLFVRTLLSAAGLDHEEQSGAVFAGWYLPDSPLDPLLMDIIFNPKDEKALFHEAKRRQRRSNHRLLFDCVNAALVDIAKYGSDMSIWAKASYLAKDAQSVGLSMTVDEVWGRVKELFSFEGRCFSGENGDNSSLVVERVVRKEVVGKGWVELLRLEVDAIGKEIEGKMLEDLLDEALVELTGGL
ncbi:hypothetical protein NE237_015062 [Protea cynaroides]|uniref:DUF4378 domain-containing protein n=1 Tax=Protea cynaroides TaxID=273540 RepID=A0A9Q0KDI3_9MAGN|nr:hypothetical protein NE237_015062 [Protea cynaroides]